MLSIIIVNYKSSEDLDVCIASIVKYEKQFKSFEFIVVDNYSFDPGLEKLKKKYLFIKWVDAEKNGGFAYGNNIGISHACGDIILLLNPDTWIDSPEISKLLIRLEDDEEMDIIGPQLLFADGSNQSFFLPKSFLTLWRLFCEQFYLHRIFKSSSVFNSYFRTYMDYSRESSVEQVSGAALMMKRRVIDKIGLLDENYFMYYEESDFCYNAVKHGFKLLYYPEARIVHKGGLTDDSKSVFTTKCFYTSFKLYFRKNFGRIVEFMALSVLFKGTLIRLIVFSLTGNMKAVYYKNLFRNYCSCGRKK